MASKVSDDCHLFREVHVSEDYAVGTRISVLAVARVEGSAELLEQLDEIGAVAERLAVELG